MTRDELIEVVKQRMREHMSVPKEFEGTARGNLMALEYHKELQTLVHRTTTQLLPLVTDYWGDKFLERLDKEIAACYRELTNKLTDWCDAPRVKF